MTPSNTLVQVSEWARRVEPIKAAGLGGGVGQSVGFEKHIGGNAGFGHSVGQQAGLGSLAGVGSEVGAITGGNTVLISHRVGQVVGDGVPQNVGAHIEAGAE
ncbi:hypothetical protein CROQUDRAFT_85861 [Cronartium quercuum f. sp. fusiforme G11]|uniref:Uncharacterized protein n=1 Tax=Cronartium quercuum f. sp. fusiforme G11 TaxID=708437 RepID=A0A9P6THW3_9BASI|nr:hypothetical protein CROQUDRAFT_85861 [Cronartium quercuum f. sp. fusiforme G11]